MRAPRQPLERQIQRRFLPFAAVGLLAPLLAVLPPRPDNWTPVWIAAGLTVAIGAIGIFAPWSRVPRWTYVLPPLAYFVVVALLRHANEGSVSEYAPLALLPVVWIAINLGRREVALGVAAGTSIFVTPLLIGDPDRFGAGEWRGAILWAAVAIIVGFAVESLMQRQAAARTRGGTAGSRDRRARADDGADRPRRPRAHHLGGYARRDLPGGPRRVGRDHGGDRRA